MNGILEVIANINDFVNGIVWGVPILLLIGAVEYSCAMKSHFRKSGNQMSGKWKSSYASLLA